MQSVRLRFFGDFGHFVRLAQIAPEDLSLVDRFVLQ
jgi:hypothetical protein